MNLFPGKTLALSGGGFIATTDDGYIVQLLGRLGYDSAVGQAQRWPLETKLLNG